MKKRSLAGIICALSLGTTAAAPAQVRAAKAVEMDARKILMTQNDFDRLIEQLARQDLRDVRAVEAVLGVELSDPGPYSAPGWVEYSPKDNHNKIGATRIRYQKKLEREPSDANVLSEVAAELSLRFPDEDRLLCDTLWNKYGKEAYAFFPDPGICLFRINGVRIFMGYSDNSAELYVSRVTLTWEKSPRPERYQVISGSTK